MIEVRGTFKEADTKTVRIHAFEVPPGTESLVLSFDYGPRKHEGPASRRAVEAAVDRHAKSPEVAAGLKKKLASRAVANLLNVVLIDAEGNWRGRWDRNPAASGKLILSERGASDGFLPGPLPPGKWSAAVEVHSILGDPVEYQLAVQPGAAKLRHRWGEAADRWVVGELHSHTQHSDGAHTVRELLLRAYALGIDFLALTDHNATSGLAEAKDAPITVLPGCELTTFFGHHPIYGLDRPLPWHAGGEVADFADLFRRARAEGGLVSVAHPFKIGDPICTGCRMDPPVDPAAIDLFEVWYRRWDDPEHDDDAALELWDRFWRDGHRVTGVAARDWHGPAQETPFPGEEPFTAVRADDDAGAVIEGLRAGRVVMTGGPLIELEVSAGRLEIRTFATEPESELRIVRSGEVVERLPLDRDVSLTREIFAKSYYRAELWQGDRPRALTSNLAV